MPLSTQVYKWVPGNLMLGVTLRWTSIPLEVEYSQSLHATETGIRSGLMGHLALTQTLPTPPYVFTKLLRPFEKHLRLQGICTTLFLDDG